VPQEHPLKVTAIKAGRLLDPQAGAVLKRSDHSRSRQQDRGGGQRASIPLAPTSSISREDDGAARLD